MTLAEVPIYGLTRIDTDSKEQRVESVSLQLQTLVSRTLALMHLARIQAVWRKNVSYFNFFLIVFGHKKALTLTSDVVLQTLGRGALIFFEESLEHYAVASSLAPQGIFVAG